MTRGKAAVTRQILRPGKSVRCTSHAKGTAMPTLVNVTLTHSKRVRPQMARLRLCHNKSHAAEPASAVRSTK